MTLKLKRIRGFAILILVNSLLTIVFLELLGLSIYYIKHDSFFYIRAPQPKPADTEEGTNGPFSGSKLVLHPFLGYIHRPSLPMSRVADEDRLTRLLYGSENTPQWTTLRANNYGFFSEHEYPYRKTNPREYIIGVFGGSAAHWFSLQGSSRLRENLNQFQFLQDRDIVVLNFSQGGFKQPQQLQALTYFLSLGQELDFLLNIDGFNEIALSRINYKSGIGAAMPSAQHVIPIIKRIGASYLDIESLGLIYKMRSLEQRRSATRSAGMWLIFTILYSRAHGKYINTLVIDDSLNITAKDAEVVHLSKPPVNSDFSTSFEDVFTLWLNASLTMQKICEAKNIPYLEIIQPNQYFSSKLFSEAERAVAISSRSPYRDAIEEGYPQLHEHVRRMQDAGINFISAVDIFDNVEAQVYSDNCCHYNQIGNELLAEFVTEPMIALLSHRTDSLQKPALPADSADTDKPRR